MAAAREPLRLPPLYPILDPEQTGNRSARSLLGDLLEGGATVLQLRAKRLAAKEFFDLAREIRAETRAFGCFLIINDRLDIALACGADGVHLGQEDVPLGVARKLMANKIIGVSTHTSEQALAAEKNGADYIGFGPLFGTSTKNTGYAARGPAMLHDVRAAVTIPIVAIGGVSENNIAQAWRAGADSAAMISDLLRAPDVAEKVRRILALRRSFEPA